MVGGTDSQDEVTRSMSGAVGPTGRNETEGVPCDGGGGVASVGDISAQTRKWGGDLEWVPTCVGGARGAGAAQWGCCGWWGRGSTR